MSVVSEARAELNGLKAMISASLQETRRIIFDLRPMILDDLGLVAALEDTRHRGLGGPDLGIDRGRIGVHGVRLLGHPVGECLGVDAVWVLSASPG